MNSKALLLLLLSTPVWASRRASSAPPRAMDVLRMSLAPSAKSYEGLVELSSSPAGGGRPRRMRVFFQGPGRARREILDDSGRPSRVIVSDGTAEWIYDRVLNRVWEEEPGRLSGKRPAPEEELARLAANYEVTLSTAGRVARRAVWLLELRSRLDHSLRRRLWVDRQWGLCLRSQSLLPDGTLLAETRFKRVAFANPLDPALFAFSAPPGAALSRRLEPDPVKLEQARQASGLSPALPRWLPAGFVFESVEVLSRGKKKLLHYRFSDGVDALSLFQCPPRMRLNFGRTGTLRVRLASGGAASAETPEGPLLAWSRAGSRFVLLGPAAPEDLRRVAESLP